MKRTLGIAIAAFALAGCGGSSAGQAQAAASCLQNELNYNVSTSCLGPQQKIFEVSNPVTVTCVHQTANEYICNASNGSYYSVTYDGQHMAYQQTQ